MIPTDRVQLDFEAEQPLLTSILRRSNPTLVQRRLGDCQLRRACRECLRRTPDRQTSVLRRMAKNEVVALILTAVGCSKT